MPDFSKAKIYKLVSNKSSDVYVGSCLIELSKRLSSHKCKSNKAVSKSMFINDAIITIVLIEDCPCENKNQMKARELHYITTLQCINKNKPFISDIQIIDGDSKKEWEKQYRLVHVEEQKQYRLEHQEEEKQYMKQYNKQYYIDNADHIKQYNLDHVEEIKQYKKQYLINNVEQIKQQKKQYRLNKKAQQLTNCINNITN